VRVSLASTLIETSKARRVMFLSAAVYIDRGVQRTRRETVHGKVKSVTTYAPNVLLHKTSSTDLLKLSKGTHALKIVVSFTTELTQHHHTLKVIVKKTISTRLNAC
jgi:hypothetical protein